MREEELVTGVRNYENGGKEPSGPLRTRVWDTAHRRRYLVDFLVLMFGIGACIGINGISAELPLLVSSAPEGSALPSYLAVAIIIAYVGPAVYALFNKSSSLLQVNNMVIWISIILVVSTVAMGLIAFFHDVTTTIFAADRSMVLLILTFISASIAGLRNVLLMPYLKNVEDANLTLFFIGEGLSGLVPSIVALIQGVGGDPVCPKNSANSADQLVPYTLPPNFSSRAYFLFVTGFLATSTISFWLLEYLRVQTLSRKADATFHHDHDFAEEHDSSNKLLDQEATKKTREIGLMDAADLTLTKPAVAAGNGMGNLNTIYLCALMWLLCLVSHGYQGTIEAFSSRPYGNSVYHLVVNLSQLAGTAAIWLPVISARSITGIVGLVYVATTYVTWLALCSPMPPWRGTTHGVVLLITIWIILISLISYAKFALTAIVWQQPSDAGLYQLAFASLSGTICSATFIFYMVNFTAIFTPYAPCELHG